MKNNRFASIERLVLVISIITATCFLNACITRQTNNAIDTAQPFDISVAEVKVISNQQEGYEDNNLKQTNQHEKRLILSVLINNVTDMDFKKVWFELQFNSEVEPYIASNIIKYTSDKMDVTTYGKALLADSKDKPSKDKPIICGFSHEWNMSLTTKQDLNSFYDLSPEKLVDELKSVTVKVHWRGGMQEITIPLELNEKDVALLM